MSYYFIVLFLTSTLYTGTSEENLSLKNLREQLLKQGQEYTQEFFQSLSLPFPQTISRPKKILQYGFSLNHEYLIVKIAVPYKRNVAEALYIFKNITSITQGYQGCWKLVNEKPYIIRELLGGVGQDQVLQGITVSNDGLLFALIHSLDIKKYDDSTTYFYRGLYRTIELFKTETAEHKKTLRFGQHGKKTDSAEQKKRKFCRFNFDAAGEHIGVSYLEYENSTTEQLLSDIFTINEAPIYHYIRIIEGGCK